MARSSGYTYNPKTGQWTRSSYSGSSSSSSSSSSNNNNTGTGSENPTSPSSNKNSSTGSENLTSSSSNKNSSTGATEKKYNTIEINTLEGTLNFIVTKATIKLKAGDTVNIKGIGKYLSGKYYVKEVTRQISSNGYSHSAVLIRTDFGKTLKTRTSSTLNKKVEKKKSVKSTPPATTKSPQRTYTVKKGDCLWNIAKQFYGNGAMYTKIYDANTNKIANPNLIYPGQIFVIT